jgi:flagellar biosynthesis/type III secretory pathway M-ring protein FliF/YscJ
MQFRYAVGSSFRKWSRHPNLNQGRAHVQVALEIFCQGRSETAESYYANNRHAWLASTSRLSVFDITGGPRTKSTALISLRHH